MSEAMVPFTLTEEQLQQLVHSQSTLFPELEAARQ